MVSNVIAALARLMDAAWLLVTKCLLKLAEAMGFRRSIKSILSSNVKSGKNREIERILLEYPNDRINALDWDTGDETEAADEILNASISDDEKRFDFSKNMARSMRQIRGYQKLCTEVENRRTETFDPNSRENEAELLKLWNLLKPEEKLEARKTNQWQKIGFQGDDPATDFRGMGMLGLDQLVFFAQFDVDNCNSVFKLSQHPRYEFPFAICGIAITAMVREFLYDGLLKNSFYNTFIESPTMDSFHQAYCCVFKLFSDFWEFSEPETVIHFNLIRQRFISAMEVYLERPDANLIDVRLTDIIGGMN